MQRAGAFDKADADLASEQHRPPLVDQRLKPRPQIGDRLTLANFAQIDTAAALGVADLKRALNGGQKLL